MKKVLKALKPALLCLIIMTILCGVIYPAFVTGIAQIAFPKQANGSIITIKLKDGTKKDFGSELIEQKFTNPKYLIGRPLGTSNLSPVGKEQESRIKQRIDWWRSFNPENTGDIPMDLITGSGSGVDPNISPQAAEFQVARIAKTRNIDESAVRDVIKKYTTGRLFGFWGEPAVNVLKVNLALEGLL
jgi:K+-transporting ATPase ATPase C chain